MRRAFQFAAAILALSVAVQPLATAATCEMASPASCPLGMSMSMSMSEMSPDCPMAQQMGDTVCMQDCCNHAVPRTAAPAVAPAKRRVGTVIAVTATAVAAPATPRPRPAIGSPAPVSSSPPHYILYRVFRI
jgi:hypothetical protein